MMTTTIMVSAGSVVTITTGTPLEGPPHTETVWVLGGALTFDLRSPSLMPHAVISEPGLALMWIAKLYGEVINDTLLSLLERGQADPSLDHVVEVADSGWVPTPLAGAARRIAVAQWLQRWWPSQRADIAVLDGPLLALERATVVWQTPLLFEPGEAAEQISPLVPELARRLGALLSEPSRLRAVDGSRRDQVVWSAAACASHCLDLDTDEFAVVAEAHELRTTAADEAISEAVDVLLEELAGRGPHPAGQRAHLAGGRAGFALAAEELFADQADHYFTVDPVQVPPRSVGGLDDNALVFVDEDGNQLQIQVTAGDVPTQRLVARVWPNNGFPLPRMVELLLTPAGYYGQTSLDDLDPTSCDVFDPRMVSAIRSTDEIRRDLDFIRNFINGRRRSAPDRFAVEEQP